MTDHMQWRATPDPSPRTGDQWTEPPRYVYTIPVKNIGDEIVLESFLIRALKPVDNVAGRIAAHENDEGSESGLG